MLAPGMTIFMIPNQIKDMPNKKERTLNKDRINIVGFTGLERRAFFRRLGLGMNRTTIGSG
jgi:hypothetical protein